MKISLFAAVLVSLRMAGLAPARAQVPSIPPGWQTERVVMLARHSVLAPVQTQAELAPYAAAPWPAWPVAPACRLKA